MKHALLVVEGILSAKQLVFSWVGGRLIYAGRTGQCGEFIGTGNSLLLSMNWVGKGGPWPWFMVLYHAQGPLAGYSFSYST